MLDFRAAGALGVTVVVAVGVAYLFGRRPEKKPRGPSPEEAEQRQVERVSATAAPPLIEVTPAPKAAQVLPHTLVPEKEGGPVSCRGSTSGSVRVFTSAQSQVFTSTLFCSTLL